MISIATITLRHSRCWERAPSTTSNPDSLLGGDTSGSARCRHGPRGRPSPPGVLGGPGMGRAGCRVVKARSDNRAV